MTTWINGSKRNEKNKPIDTMRIAVTGVGGPAGIITTIWLNKEKDVQVIGMDSNSLSAGFKFSKEYYVIPEAKEENFIESLMKICTEDSIDILIPTVDEELPILSMNKSMFEERGVRIIISSPDTINSCIDKYAFYEKLKELHISTPRTWLIQELPRKLDFPLIVKPRIGRGSRNTFICHDQEDLNYALKKSHNPIVQEFIEGGEYTIDSISDLKGSVLKIVPRKRIEIKGGVSWKGETVHSPEIIRKTRNLLEKLGIIGPACTQAILVNGEVSFFEVNPRIGGTTSLSIAAGVNIVHIMIKLAKGEEIRSNELIFRRLYVARYFADTYFDEVELK
ncbi:MAG: ATP-grasp domain-containing protein [Candidatus Thorarchaeota archaeon]